MHSDNPGGIRMPNSTSIISSHQSSFSNISSSFASAEIGMLMPILQGFMNGSGWVYFGDEIRQRDEQEALREAQLQQVALDYKADPNPENRQQLVSSLRSLLNKTKSEYADVHIKQRQAEREVKNYSGSPANWSDWLITSLKSFFGSTPEQQAEKYTQIAENRRKKINQLKSALNYLDELIVDKEAKPISKKRSSKKNLEPITFPAIINLCTLDGQNGFKIDGETEGDQSGASVSGIEDINGDGVADLSIGAPWYNNLLGRSYVIFGGMSVGSSGIIELSSLNGVKGFKLESEGGSAGFSVSSAGDVNGDNVADLLIGAPTYNNYMGRCYVIFGKVGVGSSGVVALSSLNGMNGFKLDGEGGQAGFSVSGAGDVNGDNIADLLIGAPNYNYMGRCYVIFGRPEVGSSGVISLSALNGTNGFKIEGEALAAFYGVGYSVSGAGDINGDGIDDLLLGMPYYNNSGRSYVIFGGSEVGGSGVIALSTLNGMNGFKLDGDDDSDSGESVSAAGDVNGDDFGDLLIGTWAPSPFTYVIFGGPEIGKSGLIALSALNGTNGFMLDGGVCCGVSISVSGPGDINGDGIDDLLIGSPYAGDGPVQGSSYVIFGGLEIGSSGVIAISALNGENGFVLNGETVSYSGSSVSGVGDINGDRVNDLLIGGYGYNNFTGRSYVTYSNGVFPPDCPSDSPNENGSLIALVIGITLGGVGFLALSSYLLYRYRQKQVTIILSSINNDPSTQLLSHEPLDSVIPEEAVSELDSAITSVKTISLPDSGSDSQSKSSFNIHPSIDGLPKKAEKDEKEEKKSVIGSESLELKLSLNIIALKDLHFNKKDKLGAGAYGAVYQGDYNFNQVAIKQLYAQHLSVAALEELKQEATIMGSMSSDYIVPLRGVCLEEPHYCLVMQLMPKGSLYHLLKNNSGLPESVVLRIALDIISGLCQLHKAGILHRDLKSLNVLLDDGLRAKIGDFGLSKVKSEVASQSTARPKGTLGWMSPELCDEKPASTASDIYAYGMVLWELMVRPYQIPFQGLSPRQIMAAKLRREEKQEEQEKIPADCPADISGLIKSCWRTASQRPTAETLMKSLQPIFAAVEQKAKPASSSQVEPLIQSLAPSYGSNLESVY